MIDSIVQRLDSFIVNQDGAEEGESTVSVAQRNSNFTKFNTVGSKRDERMESQACNGKVQNQLCIGISKSKILTDSNSNLAGLA